MKNDQGQILLSIARSAIANSLHIPYATSDETAPWLIELGASFVTLTRYGKLRGCIGSIHAYRPLLIDVKTNAVSAALFDPRFPPLRLKDFETVQVEVSLLTKPELITFTNESTALSQLRPGIDGVVFEYDRHRSTFLPQVWGSLPQPDLFLTMLKRKAGLPDTFWAADVKLFRYTVTKWHETDLNEESCYG